MRKLDFWKADWFLGITVVVVVALFNWRSDLIASLERKAYDLGVMATSRTPSDRVVVISIDKQSIENIGRWPWPRDVHAKMVDILANAKAKAVGFTVFFSQPENEKINQTIAKLLEAAAPSPPAADQGATSAAPAADRSALLDLLRQAEQDFNTDRKLAASAAAAGNVVLPVLFTRGAPKGNQDKPLPEFVRKNAVAIQGVGGDLPEQTSGVAIPVLEPLGAAAAGVGHLNSVPDVDGAVRFEALAVTHYGEFYPSLAVMLVAKSLNLGMKDVLIKAGEAMQIGNLKVGTDPQARMYTYFYKDRDGRQAIPEDSFFDIYSGKIKADKYRDKIVLVGITDPGTDKPFPTPVAPAMLGVQLVAHSVSSILEEHSFAVPGWALIAETMVLLLVAAYLIALLPRLKAGTALLISGSIFVAVIAAHFMLMTGSGIWMQLMLPATLLLIGHGALVSRRFIATERAKVKSDETSAESNRMLGLAYQGQGLLDQAWDKYRQVPMSGALMDNLYSLALDFERKRQFNKAESVLRHMVDFDPKFRDLEERLARAKQLSETVLLGGAATAGRSNASILGAGGSVEKPMLGRYQVEKELGKGAMGVVYLGRDPKIGRVVAIKTMALSQEFEADELAEAKERFFREAESAGRLSHPNIVTIYDAGEEHDLCYIAMELLKGGDLVPFCKMGNLLAPEKAASIIARAAEALGYAHKQGVVHRDVKPANMMYHPETDTLKMADFGIARLTDSSKTKTGMVLGTPSYMSPEQLAGKKIEGRSDLFSLAVSLYQLLSGRLPFQGESMAQLMYKIANEPPADILSANASVAPGLVSFLQRALAKIPDERFQTGEEFAAALRAVTTVTPAATAARQATAVDIEL